MLSRTNKQVSNKDLKSKLGLRSNRIGSNLAKFDSTVSNRTYINVRFVANRTKFVEYSQFDELS